ADVLAETQPARGKLPEGNGADRRNRYPLRTIDGVVGDDDVTLPLPEIGGLENYADGTAGAGSEHGRAVVGLGEIAVIMDAAQVQGSQPVVAEHDGLRAAGRSQVLGKRQRRPVEAGYRLRQTSGQRHRLRGPSTGYVTGRVILHCQRARAGVLVIRADLAKCDRDLAAAVGWHHTRAVIALREIGTRCLVQRYRDDVQR